MMMDDLIRRCTRCLMPSSYPAIFFDSDGVCNQCLGFKRKEQLGEELLLEKLRAGNGDTFDCVTGISGGKDSCYVAYLAKAKYKLRTLAVCYDFPFLSNLARENIRRVCKKLNLDLMVVNAKNNLEHTLLRNHLISVGATGTSWGQCIFCHYGIDAVLFNIAVKKNIPFILSGVTRYELFDPANRTRLLLKRIRKLPIDDIFRFIYYQSKAYLQLVEQRRQFRLSRNSFINVYAGVTAPKDGPVRVNVFDYVQWESGLIEKVLIEKTGWVKPDRSISWGYDCSLESLLDYTYKMEFGISTVGIYLSNLIRDGKISRDKALKILEDCENEELLRKKIMLVFEFLQIPKSIRNKFFSAIY